MPSTRYTQNNLMPTTRYTLTTIYFSQHSLYSDNNLLSITRYSQTTMYCPTLLILRQQMYCPTLPILRLQCIVHHSLFSDYNVLPIMCYSHYKKSVINMCFCLVMTSQNNIRRSQPRQHGPPKL